MGELSIERDQVFRIRTTRTPGTLAAALTAVGELGAQIGEIVTVHVGVEHNIREVTVIAPDDASLSAIAAALSSVDGVEVLGEVDKVEEQHRGGKIGIHSRAHVRTLQDMREVYTPGVARIVSEIAANPARAYELTWKGNTVAVVSNGSRVLGLGSVGPIAALPVMEGKALFYAELVGLNAVPIVLDADDPGDIIDTVIRLAPGFAGIHLEDIATPGVYRVERELAAALDIPILHDDQHGTAVVLVAAVLSALTKLGRDPGSVCFGQVGLGAAGSAIAGLASGFGFARVIGFDPDQAGVDRLREVADPACALRAGTDCFDEVLDEADVLVLTTGRPGLLDAARVRPGQIVLSLTNPVPEIAAAVARAAGAALAADGSIVNNVLAFPGLFRGAIDAKAREITPAMKRAAALAIARAAPPDQLLPDPLDRGLHRSVAEAVALAAALPEVID